MEKYHRFYELPQVVENRFKYITITKYGIDGTPAILLTPEAVIDPNYVVATVNLHDDGILDDGEDYVNMDVNNAPELVEVLVDFGLVKPTGLSVNSGFVNYPTMTIQYDSLTELPCKLVEVQEEN